MLRLPMTIHGYAVPARAEPLGAFAYEPSPLGAFDIEVRIECCGLCHSDLHVIDDDWGISRYPLVPGHEIVGRVAARGAGVDWLEPGERVGIGWQRSGCLLCEHCLRGAENMCPGRRSTCIGHHGGLADAIRTDARFVYPIPDALPSAAAAPLLCAGATVYAPMRRYALHPAMRVAVLGIGGLGHLALQFAAAFGCEVSALSSSPDKEEEARGFGAEHFLCTADGEALAGARAGFDFILSTTVADLDWPRYVDLLKPGGVLCFVGRPGEDMRLPLGLLMKDQKTITGSNLASRATIREMLELAARRGIRATIETMPMSRVNDALDRLRANRARYRLVLEN